MPLTEKQKKRLRGQGHTLKPVILVGSAGLSQNLLDEFQRSLQHHELMKVRISADDRQARNSILESLRAYSGAELVQRIGNVGLYFLKRDKDTRFPDL